MTSRKPILCLDFDGVIHSYDHGWQDGTIYGTVVSGFFDWLKVAQEHFTIVIYSSRSKTPEGIAEMKKWLTAQNELYLAGSDKVDIFDGTAIAFASEKPPAFLTIDDRALQFNGNWYDDAWWPEKLLAFKP